MTDLLKKAIREIENLPEDRQDAIAARILKELGEHDKQDRSEDWAWDAIKRATGSATAGLETDEILALTRDAEGS